MLWTYSQPSSTSFPASVPYFWDAKFLSIKISLNLIFEGRILTGKPQDRYVDAGKPEEAARLEAQAKAFAKVIEKELEILGLKQGMKVLDAGCGTGAVSRKIALKVSPGEVCGVDIDSLFIDEAKRLATNEGVKNVRFEFGDVNNLKYDNGTFDVSYCRLVLMHVKDPVKTVAEMKRITKRDGFVAASDNDDGGILTYPAMPKLLDLWSKYGQWAKTRGEDRYIGRKLFSIFSQAGLSSISVYPFPICATQQTPEALKMLISVPFKIIESGKETMMNESFMTAKEYEEGMKEFPLLLNHPGAFVMGLSFLAVGKVP